MSEIILTDSQNNILEYVEIINPTKGAIDANRDMLLISDNNPKTPNSEQNIYELIAHKVISITDSGNSINYPSTKAIVDYVEANSGGIISGTTNRIDVSGTRQNPIIDISRNYIGQNTINQLGIITGGTWEGNVINNEYISGANIWNDHVIDTSIHFAQSAITITENQVTDLIFDLQNRSLTGHTHDQYSLEEDLISHTGDTSIHFAQSAITITENQVTDLVNDLQNRSLTGHTHDQYGLQEDLISHTGDTSIHFVQSAITITENQVTDLANDLQNRSLTGHSHNQYSLETDLMSHTGDTSIHYTQSAITITENQVTGLVTDLQNRSLTGHTHNLYGLQTDLETHTGDTAIHFTQNDINIVGTITGGTWNGIPIHDNYISGATKWDNKLDSNIFNMYTGTTAPSTYYNKNYIDNIKYFQLYQPNSLNPFVYTDNAGNFHIDGNIIQSGSTYNTHAEELYTTKDKIILRDGAISGLANGEYTGILAKKYDGTNDGQLVFDNKGWARVGDVGSEQMIATREDIPTNNWYAKWDSNSTSFITVDLETLINYKLDSSVFLTYTGNTNDKINNKLETSVFSSYTGDTNILINNKVNTITGTINRIITGGTIINPIIDISPNYIGQNSINIVGTITGGTWNGDIIIDNYISGSTKWNNHVNDTSVHFAQSAITITESQVTNLVNDLGSKSNTGHTHNQYSLETDLVSHTGDTSIHYAQSAITITENQVTGLVTDLAGKSSSAHTHSHTVLSGLGWVVSKHTGTSNSYASFDTSGNTALIPITKIVQIVLPGIPLTVATLKARFPIPSEINGWQLTGVSAYLMSGSTSGTPTFDIYNRTTNNSMLSTLLTIDVNENSSNTAAIPVAINPTYKLVATDNVISVDCTVAGTNASFLSIKLTFSPI